MRRFFIPPEAIQGDRVVVRGSEAHHLATVLRLQPGDRVVVFDGTGREYVVQLAVVAPAEAVGAVIDIRPGATAATSLTLVQGVPKGAKMDLVIRMGTELGIAEFVPALAARSVAGSGQRAARWRRIAVEAAKQSRRVDVPMVHEPVPFPAALDLIAGHELVLVLWEGEDHRTIADALVGAPVAGRVAMIVGPEGGLTSDEVGAATAIGGIPVSLGALILRAETAGIAAAAMVFYEFGLRRT